MAGLTDNFRVQKPFADTGDKTAIPQTDITTNFVNMDLGYTIDYEREIGTDENAKAVERRKQNWLFNMMTANLKQWQEQGFPQWYKTVQYTEGSCIRYVSYTDSGGNIVGDNRMYRCLSNSTPIGMRPSGDGASATWWERIPSVGEILDSIPLPAGGGVPANELIQATTGIDFNNPATLGGTRSSGTWELASNAVAAAAANAPSPIAGMLEMKQWTVSGTVMRVQRYTDTSGGCWFRSFVGTNWTTWKTFVAAAATLAGYGIADAVASIRNRAGNLVFDASIMDSRWVSSTSGSIAISKVISGLIPAPFWWKFSGSATGYAPANTRLSLGAVANSSFPVEAGTWYDVSVWVQHATGSTFGGGVHLDFYNEAGTSVGTIPVVSTTPTNLDSPTKISATVQAPATAKYAVMYYMRRGVDETSVVSGDFYVGAAHVAAATRSAMTRITTGAGLDFNNLTAYNVYEIPDDLFVANSANRPGSDALSGTLYVERQANGIATQVYVDRAGNMWTRGGYGTWNQWRKSITSVGDQVITGNLEVSGMGTFRGPSVEIGSVSAAGPAFLDFHTKGVNRDYDARILVDTGSSSINLQPYGSDASGISNVNVRHWSGRSLALTCEGTSETDVGIRTFGNSSAGRKSVIEFGDASSYFAYIQRNSDNSVSMALNGGLTVGSEARVGSYMIVGQTGTSSALGQSSIAIGDNDTGLKSGGDGVLQVYTNGGEAARFGDSVVTLFRSVDSSRNFSVTPSPSTIIPVGAGSHAGDLNTAASYMVNGYSHPVGTNLYIPLIKGYSIITGVGYPSTVSFGYTTPGSATWASANIIVANDSGNNRVWTFNPDASLACPGNIYAATMQASQNVASANQIIWGNGIAYTATNADVYGTVWGGWLSNHLNSRFNNAQSQLDDKQNQINDRLQNLQYTAAFEVGFRDAGGYPRATDGATMHNFSMVGGSSNVGTIIFRYLQYYKTATGWVTVG